MDNEVSKTNQEFLDTLKENIALEKAEGMNIREYLKWKERKNTHTIELPRPRTVSEVAMMRSSEKELEAIAPKTGYPDLDKIIKGFIPGHLYTLTGNENVGKTSLACNFAVRIAKQGKKVLYFALEPENTVVDYIASVKFDKRFDDLEPSDLSEDDGNIHIYGKEEIGTLQDLITIVEHSDRYDLIIIDHIGYFVGGASNVFQEQSSAIKKLAGLAKSKQTAIMMIAHLRKHQPGIRKSYVPTSDDISGSGAFKQDSTEVMIVVRDLENPEGDGMKYADRGFLYVTKTKAGANGSIMVQFSEQKANIVSFGEAIAKREAVIEQSSDTLIKVNPQNFDEIDEKW